MKIFSIALLIIVIFFTDCSSSIITSSWKSDKITASEFKKIMILAIDGSQNHELRAAMENHLSDDLRERGYTVISAIKEYGPKYFEGLKEEEALSKLKTSQVDAVLTVVMLNKEREQQYVPGNIYYSPYFIHHGSFWGYYSTIYSRIYDPGYYTEQTNYFWESNLYDMSKNALLYSVQTKSFEPSSSESLGHEYGKLIIKDMSEKGLIK
jgi:hypothetical protein